MPEGPLKKALNTWLRESFNPDGEPGWWRRVVGRWNQAQAVIFEIRDANKIYFTTNYTGLFVNRALYALFGDQDALDRLKSFRDIVVQPSLSQQVAEAISQGVDSPAVKEIAEIFGALVTEPVLTLFEQYAGDDQTDPKEFARAFHGFMISLNVSGGLADTALETLTAGQVEGAGRMLESMYWSLGLGFLGWQTLAPLLTSGLQPGLERYYQRLYRPQRFGASDLRDLFALGKITRAKLESEAATLGWRDSDIDQWIDLAYKPLNQGTVFSLLQAGLITENQAALRLRALGYNPEDIPLLIQIEEDDTLDEARDTSAGTARRAFRDHLIDEAELRSILEILNYSTREIELIVGIEQGRIDDSEATLTTAQVKAAWGQNIITDPEALHWLEVAGIGAEVAGVLLETWKAEAVPIFAKLNRGTITGAYVAGILSRGETLAKLEGVGFSPEDAELEVKLAELRNPDAFSNIGQVQTRKLTLSTLNELVLVGLITPSQMETRLIELGYTQNDAALLTNAARLNVERSQRPLSQSTIERAYLAGALDRGGAELGLIEAGFTPDQAATILETIELENQGVFELSPGERTALLTAGTLQDLFIRGLINQDELGTRLGYLGLSDQDVNLLVAEAELIASGTGQPLNVSLVERAYLAGVLDRTRAAEKLTALGYSAEDVENILVTIEAENVGSFSPGLVQSLRVPTIGTLVAALQSLVITEDEFIARALELGYTPDDVSLYLAIAVRAERKGAVTLTQAQTGQAYQAGLIGRGEAYDRLYALGYNDRDASLLLRLRRDDIVLTETWAAFLSGALDAFDTISQLVAEKYTDQDIVDAFGTLSPAQINATGYTLDQIAAGLAEIPGGEG